MENSELSCLLCKRKIIGNCTLHAGTKICTTCIYNINNNIYRITFNAYEISDTDSTSCASSKHSSRYTALEEEQICHQEEIIDETIQDNRVKDVLDDLMDIDNDNIKKVTRNELDTSSFILDDIINKISDKNYEWDKKDLDFNYALLNSLYAQVEFLKQECSHKNVIISTLIKDSLRSKESMNENMCSSSHIDYNDHNILHCESNNESDKKESDGEKTTRMNINDQLNEVRRVQKQQYYDCRNDEKVAP